MTALKKFFTKATKTAAHRLHSVYNFASGYTALKNHGLQRSPEAQLNLAGGGFIAAEVTQASVAVAILCTAALPVGLALAFMTVASLIAGMAPAPLHAAYMIRKHESKKRKQQQQNSVHHK